MIAGDANEARVSKCFEARNQFAQIFFKMVYKEDY